MKKSGEDWLGHAAIDLRTIDRIIDDAELTPSVAFHSQQCIEKSFKAILDSENNDIPRTHNLILLHAKVKDRLPIDLDEYLLSMINETYIKTRYPAEIGIEDATIPSKKTVQLFFEQAKLVFEAVQKHIQRSKENWDEA